MLYTAETMQCELLRLTFCIQTDFLEIPLSCCVYQQFVPLHCSVVAHDVNALASFLIYLLKDVLIVSFSGYYTQSFYEHPCTGFLRIDKNPSLE